MFKHKKLIILSVFTLAIAGSVVFISSQYALPILMYHSVDKVVPKDNVLTVSVDTFEKQMAFFKKNHYQVLALDSVADYVSKEKKVPSRAVVLTFDDGNEDNYTYAFPILKKYDFPATIFVIVSEVGKPGRLSWGQIRQMRSSGLVSFGSHTLTHPFLPQIESDQLLKNEIRGSKNELEKVLDTSVDTFCYPMGRFDPRVEAAVKDSGYKLAVATNPGYKFSSQDIFAVKRLRISENTRNMFIFWFETSGYYNFIREIRQHRKER
ncbi:MAG: polysaccharide deacetylase family protein [Candidatus Omnitrophica bacterium]|nr:polysaccharide deacetylase family protein [Candidatus Omnitrophota bacterium]